MQRQINEAGLQLIESFEGLRLQSYQDSVGVWSIGWGSTKGVHPGMVITKATAEEMLKSDLFTAENAVCGLVKVPLNDNQFAALVSFTFNLGAGCLAHSSLLHLLNSGRYEEAAAFFLPYDHAGGVELAGLKRRREAERDLFLSGVPNAQT